MMALTKDKRLPNFEEEIEELEGDKKEARALDYLSGEIAKFLIC